MRAFPIPANAAPSRSTFSSPQMPSKARAEAPVRPATTHTAFHLSSPSDSLEQEADAIAERIGDDGASPARASRPLPSGTSATTLSRKCSKCAGESEHDESGAPLIMRSVDGAAGVPARTTAIDGAVAAARASDGRPLQPEVARSMGRALGFDLSAVRVHASDSAAASAAAIGARAFTLGSDIVFGRHEYAPTTPAGRKLLAHELAHVVQHASGRTPPERLSRQAVPALRPPPVVPARPPLRVIPGGGGLRPGTGAPGTAPAGDNPYREPIYVPDPRDQSFDAIVQRSRLRTHVRELVTRYEQPWATLDAGGTAPSFVTEHGTGQVMDETGTYSYRQRRYHVLPAIAHQVERARTNEELLQVLWVNIPQVTPRLPPAMQPRIAPLTVPFVPFDPFSHPRFPPDMDPGGDVRLATYMSALARKGRTIPDLRQEALPVALADVLRSERVPRREGPCDERSVPHAGGSDPHNAYARAVTGSANDFHLRTPEGIACQTDGKDSRNVTWEVKTLHRYLTDTGIIDGFLSGRHPRGEQTFHEIISRLEEQRARCVFVTARCGYRYQWAFDNSRIVAFMNSMWLGIPPVLCRNAAGAPC